MHQEVHASWMHAGRCGVPGEQVVYRVVYTGGVYWVQYTGLPADRPVFRAHGPKALPHGSFAGPSQEPRLQGPTKERDGGFSRPVARKTGGARVGPFFLLIRERALSRAPPVFARARILENPSES